MTHLRTSRSTFLSAAALGLIMFAAGCSAGQGPTRRIPVTVSHHAPDMPQVFGVPVPQGELHSPDHVRVLNAAGREIPSQITKVSTWEPADASIKWLWVFFFTDKDSTYTIEYGDAVSNGRLYTQTVSVRNNQRPNGEVMVTTGPLRYLVRKGEGGGWMNTPAGSGFLDKVELDLEGDGFEEDDVIASGTPGRGSFVDLVDPRGTDRSRAVVTRTVKELGSGPLHSIVRVEGEYVYDRSDNNRAPFVMRIHAFAGKSYLKVDHTFVYTGDPDQHRKPPAGYEYANVATQAEMIIDERTLKGDPGWTKPNDQIEAAGLRVQYHLAEDATVSSAMETGPWWAPTSVQDVSAKAGADGAVSLLQTGPNPSQIPPLTHSGPDERFAEGFKSSFTSTDGVREGSRAPGWMTVQDASRAITVGFNSFFQEYPKELHADGATGALTAFIWSPEAGPLSFARKDDASDSEMTANFAQGLAKSTELYIHFHAVEGGSVPAAASVALTPSGVRQALHTPPVASVSPEWIASSHVFGTMAPSAGANDPYERGLDYKMEWMRFNQQWEPWYGLLNHGDFMTYYYGNEWQMWTNNEPANDYMWWLQFARTGNPDYYRMARQVSRHTMDVDNVHWPADPEYVGDTNFSVDAFTAAAQPKGSPYVGMGRRHAEQHYTALLSAHVWVAGWVADYYMDAHHRGLDVARLTADYYVRRPFGDHGLKGRRLYLSIWNLAEVYDATKDERYWNELMDRVRIMRELQYGPDQGGAIVIDRYGYSQIYVANGLRKVYQMTGDPALRESILDNARRLRDNPPLNHDMESFLSSISSLLLGYELSGERSLLDTALDRAAYLKTGVIPQDQFPFESQRAYADALEAVSEFPKTPGSRRPPIWQIANGLRIFGWTSIYQVPYLQHWLQGGSRPQPASPKP